MARINGNNNNNTLRGTASGDIIQGFDGADNLHGYQGNDVLYGGNGHDSLYGGAGRDTLYGGDGHDRLFGGDGADVFYSGAGADDIWGGSGGDGFVFNSFVDNGRTAAVIHDWGAGDYIRLNYLDGNVHQAGNNAFTWRGYDANGGPADEGRDLHGVSYNHAMIDGEWHTVINVRNKTDAGFNDPNNHTQIWLEGRHNLTADDFIL